MSREIKNKNDKLMRQIGFCDNAEVEQAIADEIKNRDEIIKEYAEEYCAKGHNEGEAQYCAEIRYRQLSPITLAADYVVALTAKTIPEAINRAMETFVFGASIA